MVEENEKTKQQAESQHIIGRNLMDRIANFVINNRDKKGNLFQGGWGILEDLQKVSYNKYDEATIIRKAQEGERERVLKEVYDRLIPLFETVELHGHYRQILTDADISCLFAELRDKSDKEKKGGKSNG